MLPWKKPPYPKCLDRRFSRRRFPIHSPRLHNINGCGVGRLSLPTMLSIDSRPLAMGVGLTDLRQLWRTRRHKDVLIGKRREGVMTWVAGMVGWRWSNEQGKGP